MNETQIPRAAKKPRKQASLKTRLQEAYRALEAIEHIVSDDFCEQLEYRTLPGARMRLRGALKVCEKKIGMIYMISHSESPNHSCHDSHDSWREIKDTVLTVAELLPEPQHVDNQSAKEQGGAL